MADKIKSQRCGMHKIQEPGPQCDVSKPEGEQWVNEH